MKTRLKMFGCSFGAPKKSKQPGDYFFHNKWPQNTSTLTAICLARSAWDSFPWEVGHHRRQASKFIFENFNILKRLIVFLGKTSGVLSAFPQGLH